MDYDQDHHDDGADHDYLNWLADAYDDSAGDHYYDRPAINVDDLLHEPGDDYKPRHADEHACSDDVCADLDSTHLYECHFEPDTDYVGKHRPAKSYHDQLVSEWLQHYASCTLLDFLEQRPPGDDDKLNAYADGYLAGYTDSVHDSEHADCYGCDTDDGECYATGATRASGDIVFEPVSDDDADLIAKQHGYDPDWNHISSADWYYDINEGD